MAVSYKIRVYYTQNYVSFIHRLGTVKYMQIKRRRGDTIFFTLVCLTKQYHLVLGPLPNFTIQVTNSVSQHPSILYTYLSQVFSYASLLFFAHLPKVNTIKDIIILSMSTPIIYYEGKNTQKIYNKFKKHFFF